LAEHRITAFTCTPTVLAALPFTELPDLRLIVLGGEALHPDPLIRWLARYPVANAYGPTELTTEALVAFPIQADHHPVPIGRPYPGIGVRILDAAGQPVPDGQVGELYLSGPGLALEYLGLPAQTAAAFPHLRQGTTLTRHFRTGDLVQRLPDGQLTFIGRRDRQLNLGGVRVEPGEVETCALQLDGVRAAAATTVTRDNRTALALVVVADPVMTKPRLRTHLAGRLPAAAVPTEIHLVDQLPHTPSGKIDYTALSHLAPPSCDDTGPDGTLAALPELVLGWWQDLTGQPATAGADFFAAGGTSLAALRLTSQINQEFGTTLTITDFLADPTTQLLTSVLASPAVAGDDVP
jgi:acyl-coenzyme A synthetase/AMP-(fatty) acid ligase